VGLEEQSTDTFGWLERHRDGDPEALAWIFERHMPLVERIVRVRLRQRLPPGVELADVVQATLLKALEKLDSFQPRDDARLRDWLSRIAENHIRNLSRGRKEASLEALATDAGSATRWHPAAEGSSPSQRLGRAERKEIVDTCLADLPESQREVILWRDYHQASWERTIEELGYTTRQAAYQIYQRARAALRERVARRLRDERG
jgi:RNA polymerase sigma factor (sigma-70 family)